MLYGVIKVQLRCHFGSFKNHNALSLTLVYMQLCKSFPPVLLERSIKH